MKDFIIENGILEKYEGADTEVVIPDGVTYIDEYAFKNCDFIQSVTMPKGITHIGKGAFYNCNNIRSIAVPADLKIIGAWAFSCCNRLETIMIPNGVFSIGEGAFFYCSSLQKISIPNGVTKIDFHTFNGCRNLQSMMIPDSVMRIEYDAFCNCESLHTVSVGNGVTEIHKDAFPDEMYVRKWVLAPDSENEAQCKMLLDTFGTANLALSFLSDTMETNDIIRKKLKSRVTNRSFREYFIPVLIEQSEAKATAKMLSFIKKIPAEELDIYIEKADHAPEIRVMLLEYKNRLYPTEILDRMEDIKMEKALGLREKTLADYKKIFSIKKENGFYIITKYKGTETSVTIPAQIRGIPVRFTSDTFRSNERIETVCLEDGITSIENGAFYHCINLRTVSIPDSVIDIGKYAFAMSEDLTLNADKDSYAAKYAEEMQIKFSPI